MISLARVRNTELFGGKAVSLGRLIRAGFTVQPGIALPYKGAKDTSSITLFNLLATTIGSLKTTMQSEWAVRSSAIGEDGTENSFAGQHDTVLNTPAWELEQAVASVRASAYTGRATAYRRDRKINGGPKMGVVIQRMVPNVTMSAVVFTRDPITGNDDIVIEYTSGLGDKLVSGEVTPQQICVPKEQVPHLARPFNELGVIAYQVARVWKCPVDIEACYDSTLWWLCQARPITT